MPGVSAPHIVTPPGGRNPGAQGETASEGYKEAPEAQPAPPGPPKGGKRPASATPCPPHCRCRLDLAVILRRGKGGRRVALLASPRAPRRSAQPWQPPAAPLPQIQRGPELRVRARASPLPPRDVPAGLRRSSAERWPGSPLPGKAARAPAQAPRPAPPRRPLGPGPAPILLLIQNTGNK